MERHEIASPPVLGPILADTLRRLRLARLILQRNRHRYLELRDTLRIAIELLRDKDQEIDRLREQNQALRAELRRYTAAAVAGR